MAEGVFTTITLSLPGGSSVELPELDLGPENEITFQTAGDHTEEIFLHHDLQAPTDGVPVPPEGAYIIGPFRVGSRLFPNKLFSASATDVTILLILE